MSKLTAVSLFCGAGGMDLGFEQAGIDIIWGMDIDNDNCETRKHWFKGEVVCKNIKEIRNLNIPKSDVLVASIPPVNIIETRRMESERKYIPAEMLDAVKETISANMPKAIIVETLAYDLSNYKSNITANYLIEFLKELDYQVYKEFLNFKDYEICINQRRLVIVAIKNNIDIRYTFPEHSSRLITIGEVLERTDDKNFSSSDRLIVKMKTDIKLLDYHKNSTCLCLSRLPVVKKIDDNSSRYYTITWKEASLLKSFPEEFYFYGSIRSKFRQIYSSFPPKLAYKIATDIKNCLDGVENADYYIDILKHKINDLTWKEYEDLCEKIFCFLFEDNLRFIERQAATQDKNERRDLIYQNLRKSNFFERVFHKFNADLIVIDAKYYSAEIEKYEVITTDSYLKKELGNFAIIATKIGINESALRTQIKLIKERNNAILVVNNEDFIKMLEIKKKGENPDEVLNNLLNNLLMKC